MAQRSSRRVCLVSAAVIVSLAFGLVAWSPAGRDAPPLPAAHAAPTNTTAYIVSTIPADGAVNVALTTPIVVTFSEPMNTSTVTWAITPALAVVVTWDPTVTILTMAHTMAFASCTVYTVHVLGVAPGPVPNPWSFRTTCPGTTVIATSPPDGAVDVPLNASIVVEFSGPMDPASVTWTITPAILLTSTWSSGNTVLTATHVTLFAACTNYTVTVDGSDAAGIPLFPGPYAWSFRTFCPTPVYSLTVVNLPPGGVVNARLVIATQP